MGGCAVGRGGRILNGVGCACAGGVDDVADAGTCQNRARQGQSDLVGIGTGANGGCADGRAGHRVVGKLHRARQGFAVSDDDGQAIGRHGGGAHDWGGGVVITGDVGDGDHHALCGGVGSGVGGDHIEAVAFLRTDAVKVQATGLEGDLAVCGNSQQCGIGTAQAVGDGTCIGGCSGVKQVLVFCGVSLGQ